MGHNGMDGWDSHHEVKAIGWVWGWKFLEVDSRADGWMDGWMGAHQRLKV